MYLGFNCVLFCKVEFRKIIRAVDFMRYLWYNIYSYTIKLTGKRVLTMRKGILTTENIINTVKPIALKYGVEEIYLFGSYARGEATVDSDLDFLVFGGKDFKLTMIFALAEDLRESFNKNVDVFEINEINTDSDFYNNIMKERLLVA